MTAANDNFPYAQLGYASAALHREIVFRVKRREKRNPAGKRDSDDKHSGSETATISKFPKIPTHLSRDHIGSRPMLQPAVLAFNSSSARSLNLLNRFRVESTIPLAKSFVLKITALTPLFLCKIRFQRLNPTYHPLNTYCTE